LWWIICVASGCGWFSRHGDDRAARQPAARDTLSGKLVLIDSTKNDIVFAVKTPSADQLIQYLKSVPGDTAAKELWVITGWASDSTPTRVHARFVEGNLRLAKVSDASGLWKLHADEEVQILYSPASAIVTGWATQGYVAITPKDDALEGQLPDSFPWPPPAPTSRFEIPLGLVVRERPEHLTASFSRIREAFRRADLQNYAVYPIGRNGFAVVAPMERISDVGQHVSGSDRWAWDLRQDGSRGFDPKRYAQALIAGRRGRYRVIVVTVTARQMARAADSSVDSSVTERIRRLNRYGDVTPPLPLARTVADPGTRCVALIYELERATEDAQPKLLTESAIPPVAHLIDAGLWPSDRLRP
jgi:hypothetical protein